MRERLLILLGCCVFIGLFSYPLWRAAGSTRPAMPQLQTPRGTECVAPAEEMRRSHMKMLIQWREDVVRRGDRKYTAWNGKVYNKSLTGTCLGCHDRQQFCERCHASVGVSTLRCWNCHNAPQTAKVMP